MRVCLHPQAPKKLGSGMDLVISKMHQLLPLQGIELVPTRQQAHEVLACHVCSPAASVIADVIHCHGLYPTSEQDFGGWFWEINKRIIEGARKALAVTVPSAWIAEIFIRDMGFRPDIVPHGIDLSEWPDYQHSLNTRHYDTVLWNKNRPGDVCDPTPVNELAKLLPDLKFRTTFGEPGDNVEVIGSMPHATMKAVLYDSGIYLATTKETFGIGILEAMATGMPVVGWKWGHVPELVRHELDGILVEPYDYGATADAIKHCLQYHEKMSVNARERAAEYPWTAAIKAYVEIYERVVQEKARLQEPHVSIVIPCHNYAQYITQAIQSVKDQTWEGAKDRLECVIVDDGSTDTSIEVIEEAIANDARFTLITQENLGVAAARNKGVHATSGEFVACLDADDAMLPDALKTLMRAFKRDPALGLAFGKISVIDADGHITHEKTGWPDGFSMEEQLKRHNQVPSFNLMRRRAFDSTGGFRQHFAPAEDAELWTRIGLRGWNVEMATPEPVYLYRVHDLSITKGIRTMQESQSDWLGCIPSSHGGAHPMASLAKSKELSHPVRSYDLPLVSFVIPVGESHKRFLEDALESVIAQLDPHWEVVVVDDTDDGNLASFSEIPYREKYPFVKWVRNPELRNVSVARNRGVQASNGWWLCFLDADDFLHPEFLTHTLLIAKECLTDTALIYTDWVSWPNGEVHKAENWNLRKLMNAALFAVTYLHPRSAFDEVGGFDEKLPGWEDWDYTVRLGLLGYKGIRVPKPLFTYRYDTGVRRELCVGELRERLIDAIRQKYQGVTPMARRP